MISLEGKLEFLLELDQKDHLSTEDMRTIEQFSSDDTDEVRIRVAEILNNFSSDFSDKLLLKLIDDKSCLIRSIQATESGKIRPPREDGFSLAQVTWKWKQQHQFLPSELLPAAVWRGLAARNDRRCAPAGRVPRRRW